MPIPVFRVEKNANYTTMSNFHLRDKTLSLKAKGLLSMLLSLPESWNYSVRGLATISREGKDGILSALQELEKTAIWCANKDEVPPVRWSTSSTSFLSSLNHVRIHRVRKSRTR